MDRDPLFALFHEYDNPARHLNGEFLRRHDLRFAGEGFALPSLEIRPEGTRCQLEWKNREASHQHVAFLDFGTASLSTDQVRSCLSRFVEQVLARLNEQEPPLQTPLHEEWNAIVALEPEERDFCEVTASLGLDPFFVSEEEQRLIIRTHDALPSLIVPEFFAGAQLPHLDRYLHWFQEGKERIQSLTPSGGRLRELRKELARTTDSSREPWKQGYDLADRFRTRLGWGEAPLSDDRLIEMGFNQAGYVTTADETADGFEGLVDFRSTGEPGFFLRNVARDNSRRFLFARALFECLYRPDNTPSLLTRTRSDGQKRNRAFAAELFAPADALRQRIVGDRIDVEQVEDLAVEFGVSAFVIKHQIQNHCLAQVVET